MNGSPSSKRAIFAISIRMKLILINLTLLLGVGIYAYYEQSSFTRLSSLEHAASNNLNSSVDLLMLRRHEKDFLARKQDKYITKFDDRFEQLMQRIQVLHTTLASHDIHLDQQHSEITSTLVQYQSEFHQLAQITSRLYGDDLSLTTQLSSSREALKRVVTEQNDIVLKIALLELVEAELGYLASPSEQNLNAFTQSLATFSSLPNIPINVLAYFDRYKDLAVQHMDKVVTLGLTPNKGVRGSLRNNVHVTEQAIARVQGQINSVIINESDNIKNQLQLMGAAIVAVLTLLLYLIGRSILSRIQAINLLMTQIASGNGDLTVRMNAKGNDELANLAHSFDRFISSLHGHIKDLAGVMTVLSESSCSSEQASIKSMDNAQQQKLESESVATAVNELVMTTNEITANIESAAQNSQRMKSEAQSALDKTHATGERIEVLAESIEQSQSQVMQLEDQSREINQVISTIQSIAEQTNLLALNAAIEAARAGESGRGFAVVADEVRKLASITNDSTHQIEATIQGLTNGITQTVSQMQSSAEQARTTNTHTHEVVRAIDSISVQIGEMFDMNSQIATASEEQSAVSSEIDRNITEIAHLASNTYDIVSGSVKCSEQVSGVSTKLDKIVAQFKY